MLVGTGQKALVSRDNQMRMPFTQALGAQALLFQLAIAKIFQKHVGARKQALHRLPVLGLGKIEDDAALAAIEQREE